VESRHGPWFTVGALALVVGAAWAGRGFQSVSPAEPLALIALAVGWVVALALASTGLGWPIVRWTVRRAPTSAEDWLLVQVCGAGGLIAVAWGLSLIGWLRPGPLLVAFGACVAVGVVWLVRSPERPRAPEVPWPVRVAAAVFGLGALLVACTLSPFYDQWHQHLGLASQWLRHGEFAVVPRNYYSYMPGNLSLLFTYALAGLGPWAAQVMHWWMGCLAAAAAAVIGHRLGGRGGAAWAAVLFLTAPTVMALATTAGTDLGIAALAGAAWMLVLRAFAPGERDNPRLVWLAGVMVGLAVGCKYVALTSVALPVGFAVLLLAALARIRGERSAARSAAAVLGFTLAAVAAFSPWAVRNLVDTGSPLFPFLPGLMAPLDGTAPAHGEAVASYLSAFEPSLRHMVAGLDLGGLAVQADGFPTLGPLIVALLPVAVVLVAVRRGTPVVVVALGALTGVLLWLPAMHICRYLLGVLVPLVAVLAAAAAWVLGAASRPVRVAIVGLLATLLLWGASSALSPLGLQRLACTLGQGEPEEILRRWVSYWPAVAVVNEQLPADAKVLMVAESRALLLDRSLVLEHPLLTPFIVELAETSADAASMAAHLHGLGVTHVLINRHEARRIAAMNGRGEYFATVDPASRRRLRRFLARWLREVWAADGVEIYALRSASLDESVVGETSAPRHGRAPL
jgi:hypothetical protein